MSILQIVKFCGALIIMLIISIPLCLAILLAGVPTVLGTFHVLPSVDVEGRYGKPVHRRLERRSNSALDLAIAVSDAAKRDWVARTQLHPEKVVTIHNGIDPHHFRRRSPPVVSSSSP